MRKKSKSTAKVKPLSQRKTSTTKLVYEPPSETFDAVFPLTLKFMEGKDEKVCYFQCQEHLDKYLNRSGLKPKDYKVSKTVPKIKDILDFLNDQ